MSSAGADADLLLLIDRAHERVETLEIVYEEWEAPRASNHVRIDRSADGAPRARWIGGGPRPQRSRATRRIWFQSPSRLRAEIHGPLRLLRLGVRYGPRWWRWDYVAGTSAGTERSDVPGAWTPPFLVPALLAPAQLLPQLQLRPVGEGVRAGRAVRFAIGRLRSPDPGGTETTYEFEFDAEHGTVLRRATIENGQRIELTEAVEVTYNGTIDDDRFEFDPPVGAASVGLAQPDHAAIEPGARWSSAPRVGSTLWLTGLPASGKTTLAMATAHELRRFRHPVCVLDEHALRLGLSCDLGMSSADHSEHVRRAAHLAVLLGKAGITAIVALVSPFAADRNRVRELHTRAGVPFYEVWVDTPVAVCADRDRQRGKSGVNSDRLADLAAGDGHYEPPEHPTLRIACDGQPPEVLASRVAALLNERRSLSAR